MAIKLPQTSIKELLNKNISCEHIEIFKFSLVTKARTHLAKEKDCFV